MREDQIDQAERLATLENDRRVRKQSKNGDTGTFLSHTSYLITLSVPARGGTVFGAKKAQVANDFVAAALVRRMVDAIDHRHVGKIKRAHAF